MRFWRRRLLAAGTLAAIWPTLATAQPKSYRIGLLHVGDDHMPPSYRTMVEAMTKLGFREGVNVHYDFRNVADDKAVLAAAHALVRDKVDLIIAFDQEACGAAHRATATLPIIMVHASNPVGGGFARSLARPGGNMTGFAGRPELPAKELEILKEIAPKIRRVMVLFDSEDAASVGWLKDTRRTAKVLGVTLVERDAADPGELKALFETIKPGTAEAVVFASNVIRHRYQNVILPMATARRMAMVGSRKDVVDKGALFSYSYDFGKIGHAVASRYVIPVLQGTKKPADLPIEEVTEYELSVNLGVARRHGWTVPHSILQRAVKLVE